jgi:hypothetical protein
MKLLTILLTCAMFLVAPVEGVFNYRPLRMQARHGQSKEWKCVYSPVDGASVWVTSTGHDTYGCAGPNNICYWFAGRNCSHLIISTDLVGKECCCHVHEHKGWCGEAQAAFKSKSQSTNTEPTATDFLSGTVTTETEAMVDTDTTVSEPTATELFTQTETLVDTYSAVLETMSAEEEYKI